MASIKALAESSSKSIPTSFTCNNATYDKTLITPIILEKEEENSSSIIPIIDVSLLTSTDPNQRAKVVQDIQDVCLNWGIFMVVNHGIGEEQMREIIEFCGEFFNLSEEEKKEYQGKTPLDPITCGNSVHGAPARTLLLWRDFVKVQVHPKFHCPKKPLGLSKAMEEYCAAIRTIAKNLLGGVSESLGLERCYIEKATNLESGLQLFAANMYPPCEKPELAMGLPSHTDPGLLTFLICNGVDGLQFLHKGEWINTNPPPGAFIVNVADHLQILSNEKYKSCVHRAVVNNKTTRYSIAVSNEPSVDTVLGPIPELLKDNSIPKYRSMKYMDYLEVMVYRKYTGTSCIDHVKIV